MLDRRPIGADVWAIPLPTEWDAMATPAHSVTDLLQAWGGGDAAALDRLVPIVYDELHRQAQRYLRRESPGHTLQTTALVHEAYLRLVDQREARWQNRAQFFGVAAQLMRRILVDHARRHQAAKRGGVAIQVTFEESAVGRRERDVDLVALDDALTRLAGSIRSRRAWWSCATSRGSTSRRRRRRWGSRRRR